MGMQMQYQILYFSYTWFVLWCVMFYFGTPGENYWKSYSNHCWNKWSTGMDMQMQYRILHFSFPYGLFYAVFCFTLEHLVKTIGSHTPIIAEISGALEWICKCNIEYCTFRFHMVCSMLYFVLLRNTWWELLEIILQS